MPVTPLLYSDIEDARYNPFTGVWTPKQIGYGANPVETYQIPAAAPYIIKLYESPQENVPSTTKAVIGLTTLVERPITQAPAAGQYRVCYDELGNGQVEFNSAQAGQLVDMSYYGLGHIMQKGSLDTRVPSSGNTTIAGNKTFSGFTTFSDEILLSSFFNIAQGDKQTNLKWAIIAIGAWDMDATASLDITAKLTPLIGSGSSLNLNKIKAWSIKIIQDSDTAFTSPGNEIGIRYSAGSIYLDRAGGGYYDSVSFDSTTNPANRGYLLLWYDDTTS